MSENQDALVARLDERLAGVIDRLDRIELAIRDDQQSLRERVAEVERDVAELKEWRATTKGVLTAGRMLWSALGLFGGAGGAFVINLVVK